MFFALAKASSSSIILTNSAVGKAPESLLPLIKNAGVPLTPNFLPSSKFSLICALTSLGFLSFRTYFYKSQFWEKQNIEMLEQLLKRRTPENHEDPSKKSWKA